MAHENELDYHESAFNNASEFQSHLIQRIFKERAFGIVKQIVYTNVQQPWVIDTVNALEQNGLVCFKHYDPSTKVFRVQTMATQLDNAAQEWFSRSREKWLLNKTITQAERDMLTTTADSLFQFTSGPFVGASKAPNLAVQLVGIGWPGVIFECEYSQSHDILLDDVTDWLVGSDGKTRATVLVNWRSSQTTMTVRGNVELYTLDRDGMPRLRQRKQVYPAPTGLFKEPQVLKMARQHFFGAHIAGDREPDDIFDLDIEVLRTVTTELMANMGYAPA